MFFDNYPHSMEESSESWISRSLIVDKFDFNGFHGGDREYGLANSSAQTGQKSRLRTEISILVNKLLFYCLEGAKSHCWLWNRAVQENGKTAIEAKESSRLHCLIYAIQNSRILFTCSCFPVQLQLSLDILRWICYADLNTTSDSTWSRSIFHRLVLISNFLINFNSNLFYLLERQNEGTECKCFIDWMDINLKIRTDEDCWMHWFCVPVKITD